MVSPTAVPAVLPEPLPEPLRLPRGSVRGLLAIGLMATFGYLMVRGDVSPPAVLVNAVVVALAFYFGSRGPSPGASAAPTPATRWRRPRIVRGMLLIGFTGLAGWLLWSGAGLPQEFRQILEVLAGYVLGLTLSWLFHRRVHETPTRRRIALAFRDLSAVGALGLTGLACYGFITGSLGTLSSDVEQGLSLVITYYFGSRVIAR